MTTSGFAEQLRDVTDPRRLMAKFSKNMPDHPLPGRTSMMMGRLFYVALLAFGYLGSTEAQEVPIPQLSPGSAHKPPPASTMMLPHPPSSPQSIKLSVPEGTPLQVALEEETRVKRVGQPIRAIVVEPVYAFDRLVVPVGSQVTGQVTKIEAISGGKRTIAALDADFTPEQKVEVSFTELALPDGRHFPLNTSVSPGSGQVIRFVAAAENKERKGVKDAASEKTRQAKELARQEWDKAMKELKTPDRMHRLKRYVEAQLPGRAQYIPVGTVYFAELNGPLDFGSEMMTPALASSIGGPLPPGSVVHARLVTPLTSATSQKGERVEAVISEPLVDGNHQVILPQGSRLIGTVSQVQPARRMKKNGRLRIRFQELTQPDGIQGKVEATLESVQSGKGANVKLDPEGGAEATTPKIRYLATALSLTLAAASVRGDSDVDHGVARAGGDTGPRVAGGANGFKLVGIALGLAVHSRALGYAMGAYGAGMSVYSNFIARGHDVVFPKHTLMEIGIARARQGSTGSDPKTSAAADAMPCH